MSRHLLHSRAIAVLMLLAATTTPALAQAVVLTGTAGDDTFKLWLTDAGVHMSDVNGVVTAHAGATGFTIHCLAGNDTVNARTFEFPDGPVTVPMEVHGGPGHDSIISGNGDDKLFGDDGNDKIAGYAGKDHIEGGPGDDKISGGSEDDTILGGPGKDTLHGDSGDDDIKGGPGKDKIFGGADDDTIEGNGGDDEIWGDEPAWGAGHDNLYGNKGDDQIIGGDGIDTVRGLEGKDRIWGDAGNDIIWGDDVAPMIGGAQDVIYGGLGEDSIFGGDGGDILFGEFGPDVMAGNNGDDIMFGGSESDDMQGNNGCDRIFGQADADVALEGGANDDTVVGGGDAVDPTDGGAHVNGDTCAECPPDACANCEILLPGIAVIGAADPVTCTYDPASCTLFLQADFIDILASGDNVQHVDQFLALDPSSLAVINGLKWLRLGGPAPLRGLAFPDPMLGADLELTNVPYLGRDENGRHRFGDSQFSITSATEGLIVQGRLTELAIDPQSHRFTAGVRDVWVNPQTMSLMAAEMRESVWLNGWFECTLVDCETTARLLAVTDGFTTAGSATGAFTIDFESNAPLLDDGSPYEMIAAPLLALLPRRGAVLVGDEAEVLSADDEHVLIQSELNAAGTRRETDTWFDFAAFPSQRLDVWVEVGPASGRIDRALVFVRDWNANVWRQVATIQHPLEDTRRIKLDLADAAALIRPGDGLVRVRVRTIEQNPTGESGHVAAIDLVRTLFQWIQ